MSFIDTVGFDMFMRILQESIDEKQGVVNEPEKEIETRQISADAYIPENYVNSDLEKLRLYQQLHDAKTMQTLENTKAEFIDLYGKLPREMENLVNKREFDILTSQDIFEMVMENSEGVEITFTREATNQIDGEALMNLCTQISKKIRISFKFNKVSVKFPKIDNNLELMNLFLKQTNRFMKK